MQKTPIVKGICVLVIVGTLIGASLGCQSRRCCRARNVAPMGQSAAYDGPAYPSETYSQPTMTAPTTPAPSGGCPAGCKCGRKAIPSLSGAQAFAPSSDTVQ